jgi:hypothetical protein
MGLSSSRCLARGAVAMLALAPGAVGAAPVLDISGNVRGRLDTIENQARAGFKLDETLLNLRTTITLGLGDGPIRLGAELVDSRVYSPEPGSAVSTNEVNALEPVQAFVTADLGAALGPGSTARVQAGRFLIDIGSRRLVANEDYRNTTNGFTGIRADLAASDGWSAILFYVLPQIRLPDDFEGLSENRVRLDRESFDTRLAGALFTRANALGAISAQAGLYRLDERDAPGRATRNRHLSTFSLRLFRPAAPGHWHFDSELIAQTGTIRASALPLARELAVRAWFVHGSFGYSFNHPLRPKLTFEYDQASGDGPGARYGRFDTLYGMRRPDLGPAGLYNAMGRTNVLSPGVRLELAPSKRLDGFFAVRDYWLSSRTDAFSTTGVRDPSGRAGRHAGVQFDTRIRWWAIPDVVRLEANGVYFAKGSFYRRAPNAPRAGDTRYMSLNASLFF